MNAAFLAFERASVFGFVALVVALGAQWILNGRVPSSWRVWIWRAALSQTALSLVPFAPLQLAVLRPSEPVTPVVSVRVNAPQFRVHASSAPIVSTPSSVSENGPAPVASVEVAPTTRLSPRAETIPAPRSWNWRIFILTFYVLGLGVQLVILARSFGRVRQLLRACISVEDADVRAQLSGIARRMNIRSRLPRLLETQSGAPFLTGVLRPAIVLPRAFLQDQNPALEPVLSHELAHQKRRDLAWNAVLWLVETLFWFHPLVWISRRFLALETESACDEMVLSSTRVAPKFYGALLLNTMNISQTPLAVGVNDGFFALKTRLQRLNQAPKRPHRVARIAFVTALCCAFAALIPIRFVARAQVAATSKPQKGTVVKGRVVDGAGKPVAGAVVYAMFPGGNGRLPLETTVSDAKGAFGFSQKPVGEVEVLASTRGGLGFATSSGGNYGVEPRESVLLNVGESSRARLRFVDERGVPVAGLKVRLWRAGTSPNYWIALPSPLLQTMRATTNARGVAVFPPLPAGLLAQFWLEEHGQTSHYPYNFDRTKWRYAPLSLEERVVLIAPQTSRTIRLFSPVTLRGHVALPDGQNASGAFVSVSRLGQGTKPQNVRDAIENYYPGAQTDARGNYVFPGLRPARYEVSVYPGDKLNVNWAGTSLRQFVGRGTKGGDFTLSHGALLQGVVVSQATKKPVRGQTLLFETGNDSGVTQSDMRGYFRFRVKPGSGFVTVHANGINSPPPGFILPAKTKLPFAVKDGEARFFHIELPDTPVIKPISGTVVGPDGKPVAGAHVLYRNVGFRGGFTPRSIRAGADGKFIVPNDSGRPLQLFADSGELTTIHSTITLPGDDVTLQLVANAWASVEGRVVDEKQPVAGAAIRMNTVIDGISVFAQNATSDGNGDFRFSRLRPNTGVMVDVTKNGFSRYFNGVGNLNAGETHPLDVALASASSTLAGIVLNADGTPARGFQIRADGADRGPTPLTRNDGRFFLPQVQNGAISVFVYPPKVGEGWGPFPARGGDGHLVIRLSEGAREKREFDVPPKELDSLAGQIAPEIRAATWNGQPTPLSSLRGKAVLLAFGNFSFNRNSPVEDFARSFSRRVAVVGVDLNLSVQLAKQWDKFAREMPFPVALDARSSTPRTMGGQTWALYKGAQYVVIGRDGKIVYAGDELDHAITFAASALK